MNRYALFARRAIAAREFGIAFRGTARTSMPPAARIAGMVRPIAAPDDSAMVHDVINVWLDDEYGLRCIGRDLRTIVDVGANIGLFSMLARHRFPNATIHAFEPDPVTFDFAYANLTPIGVTLYPEAVGAAEGQVAVRHFGSSRLTRVEPAEAGTIRMSSMSTVAMRVGRIDLLKLDCEGSEWDIFDDAAAFDRVGCIRLEYHLTDGHSLEELCAVVGRLGFRSIRIRRDQGFGIAWFDRTSPVAA